MKKIFGLLLPVVMMTAAAKAQNGPDKLDASPMDMSYSPNGYPGLVLQKKVTGGPNARIIYSRPQLKGRTIFGDKEKYGTMWRLGANESTELELFKDANIGGKKVSKGRYTLYALLDSLNWSLVINKDLYGWGAYGYDSTKDVVRIPARVEMVSPQENLTIYFDNNNNLVMTWDKAKVMVPFTFTSPAVVDNKPKPAPANNKM